MIITAAATAAPPPAPGHSSWIFNWSVQTKSAAHLATFFLDLFLLSGFKESQISSPQAQNANIYPPTGGYNFLFGLFPYQTLLLS